MDFTDFKPNEPAGSPYLHMNFDSEFKWDTKVISNKWDTKWDVKVIISGTSQVISKLDNDKWDTKVINDTKGYKGN